MPAKRKRKPNVRKTTKGKNRNFRSTKEGAGMTKKGVAAYRRKNPGSKLKTAVTGKVKKGSKAAKRRKSVCARSKGGLTFGVRQLLMILLWLKLKRLNLKLKK